MKQIVAGNMCFACVVKISFSFSFSFRFDWFLYLCNCVSILQD